MTGLVEGKVALVTGGATGIGRASALLFASEGARVLVSDVNDAGGLETLGMIREAGGTAEYQRADVSDELQVETLVRACVDAFGRLDCALNNAGITGPVGPLHQIEFEKWSRTLAVNLDGVFLCMKHELPIMLEQAAGAIVNTSSGSGFIATPGLAAYCATKHAILGITKTAAVENARTGVRINAICPGSTDTPLLRATMDRDPAIEKMVLASMPGGRLGEAMEIAEAAVWLCSDRASFVSGHSMLVDGGSVAR